MAKHGRSRRRGAVGGRVAGGRFAAGVARAAQPSSRALCQHASARATYELRAVARSGVVAHGALLVAAFVGLCIARTYVAALAGARMDIVVAQSAFALDWEFHADWQRRGLCDRRTRVNLACPGPTVQRAVGAAHRAIAVVWLCRTRRCAGDWYLAAAGVAGQPDDRGEQALVWLQSRIAADG